MVDQTSRIRISAAAIAFVACLLIAVHAHAQGLAGLTSGSTLSPAVTASHNVDSAASVYRAGVDIVKPSAPVTPSPAIQLHAQDTASSTGRMVVGGIMGGVVGMLVGGAVGTGLERTLSETCFEYCGLGGAVLGAVVGESLGMALGVHAGNYRRGSFGAAVVGPIGVLVGAAALGMVMGDSDVPASFVVVGIPVLQLFTSVAGERAAARRRAAAPG